MADTTGSMGSYNAAIISAASSILTSAAALGGDVAFGVGEYKDVGDVYVYRLNTDITTSQAAAQGGIGMWGAGGGGDYPESGIYGLQQAADGSAWRAGSERILVWFGDAPSHDPDNGVSQTDAVNALNANGIAVEAINVGTGDGYAPFGSGHQGLNDTDQASAIAAATGGTFYDGINAGSIVATISAAITTAISTYSTVGIDTSEVPGGIGVAVVPSDYSGSFDRSIDRNFRLRRHVHRQHSGHL